MSDEDLVQEACLRLLAAQQAGDVIANPEAWLVTVISRLWKSNQRRVSRQSLVDAGERGFEVIPLPGSGELADELVAAEERERLRREIQRLPPRLREPLRLKYIDNLSAAEIAERLGRSEGYVRVLLWEARKILRSRMIQERKELGE